MDVLQLRIADGVTLAVPARLSSMTTYVLLEQEAWFEKEIAFLRRWLAPGMTAIDIGASFGVYSLPMARLVGPDGRVFAYEPAREPRGLLERSRDLNRAVNLEIVSHALSDGERDGTLLPGTAGESSALGEPGAGEGVRVTSLDIEDRVRGWPAPDFVKIDAEGEEQRILAGGRDFFARHSPLVMFEIKAETVNEELRAVLPAMGYRLYRALAGAPVLVPFAEGEELDRYELNLFAAKPERARALAQDGFLVEQILAWQPGDADLRDALALLRTQAFAPTFAHLLDGAALLDDNYRQGLAAYAAWRMPEAPLAARCAALGFAFRTLHALCERAPSAPRLSTLARIAGEWGARDESVGALRLLIESMQGGTFHLSEPFWPSCPRFDAIAPGEHPGVWFAAAAAEQLERSEHFSSFFRAASPVIDWLCSTPFACAEMERRRVLRAARAGANPHAPPRLLAGAPDHLNADLWRTGKVPGVVPVPRFRSS